MTTQETIALAATIWDEAKKLGSDYRASSEHANALDTHTARCQTLYLKLCEEGTPGYQLHDVRVAAAALKVIDALEQTDVDQIRIPGVLALALLNLERVVRRASGEGLKRALKDVERHPSPDSRTYALVRRVDRKGALCATGDWEDVPPEEERAAFTTALAEAGFADSLARKCDELERSNRALQDELVHMKAVR